MLYNELNDIFREHRLEPVAICVVGPNGSGKSSTMRALGFEDSVSPMYSGRIRVDDTTGKVRLPLVNPDDFSAQIRQENPDIKQEKADLVAAQVAEKKRHELAEMRSDFGFETVGSHESKPRFLRELKALGYFVAVLFIGTASPDIETGRLACMSFARNEIRNRSNE